MPEESVDLKTLVNTLEGGKTVWVYLPKKNKIVGTAYSYELIYSDKIKYFANKHAGTAKHTKKMRHTENRHQILFETPPENGFYRELTKALVNSNISFHKLENPSFRNFLERLLISDAAEYRIKVGKKIEESFYLDVARIMFGPWCEPGIGVRENWEPGRIYFCDANDDSNIVPDLPCPLMLSSHHG